MQDFMGGRRLRTTALPVRVAFSGFLLFALLGVGSNLALFAWKTHLTPTGVAHYYRGYEPAADEPGEIQVAKELHELIENSHFHLYIVPVVLLILTHLFFMTSWSVRACVAVTVLAYTAAIADLAGPWLVRYGGADFAAWKLAASLVYHASLLFLIGACLWECWGAAVPRSFEPADRE